MIALHAAALSLVLCAGGGDPVLLDFFSDNCPPCRQMMPVVQQLMAKGYPVRKVNCTLEPQLAARFGVSQIPCFVMVVGGREVDRVIGLTSMARLEQMCRLGAARAPDQAPAADAPMVIPAVQGGPNLSALSSPGTPAPGPNLSELIGATVRLRILDGSGQSCGSGTIIDARNGEALILTCGHIFRESKGKGRIEVDVFGPSPAQRIPGYVLDYNLESDIGLLSIRTTGPVTVARVAPPGHRIAKGDAVVNVGCNNGDQPSPRRSHVVAVDKFMGPPNLEVAGLPVQGRSGGGLFSSEGYVIGVCNAADPTDNQGLYAALGAIQAELDRMKLSFLYQSPGKPGPAATAVASAEPPPMAREMPGAEPAGQLSEVSARTNNNVPPPPPAPPEVRPASAEASVLSDRERAALEEIQKRRLEGAEVICVIRPRNDPRAPSEIIVLDRVSPAFLQQLAGAPRPQADPPQASAGGPRSAPSGLLEASARSTRPRPLLEYTAPPPGN